MKVKSNLRYPGGKSKLIKHLAPFFPKEIENFFDVFVGGGSVTLHVLQNYDVKEVWVNDIDYDLINYYRTIKMDGVRKELINGLLRIKDTFDNENFKPQFEALKGLKSCGMYFNAKRYFIINKCGFNGLQNSTYSKQAYDKNFTNSSILKIEHIGKLLEGVHCLNMDFKDISTKHVRDRFVYMDPPYYENSKKGLYGKQGEYHKNFDHEEFVRFAKEIAKQNKIMISYDNCEWVREQFKEFNQFTFETKYSMTNNNKSGKAKLGKEIIITNYEVEGNGV